MASETPDRGAAPAVPGGSGRGSSAGELRDAIATLDVPVLLINLEDLTVTAASEAGLQTIGRTAEEILGQPVRGVVIDPTDLSPVRALEAMRDGAIDFYRGIRKLSSSRAPDNPVTIWVRRLDFDGMPPAALAEAARGTEPQPSPIGAYLGAEPLTMAVGTIGDDWRITAITADIVDLLGLPAAEVVGQRFVCRIEQRDAQKLLEARGYADSTTSVAVRVRLRNGEGSWTPLCCVLVSLRLRDETRSGAETSQLMFILMPEVETRPDRNRLAELERHLYEIAAQIQASGILHDVAQTQLAEGRQLVDVGDLTTRQWDVLRRLVRGERVPTIAQELFISQSTVRNHLAAIFERFGVHSQAELLALLASAEKDGSST
jgi:DNA-binding CsgD family transcriptional regulator